MNARTICLTTWALFAVSCGSGDTDSEAAQAAVDFTRVAATLEAVEAPGIEKLRTVSGFYLASQPDESGFQAAKRGGIRTVINLRHDEEVELDEEGIVEGLGLAYVHLPWNGEEQLTDAVFDRAREVLEGAEKPVLLHCKSANRVGAVWLPHRVLDGGLSVEAALKEARSVGLKSAAYEQKALDYIERNHR